MRGRRRCNDCGKTAARPSVNPVCAGAGVRPPNDAAAPDHRERHADCRTTASVIASVRAEHLNFERSD
jgi:hypothetical protein